MKREKSKCSETDKVIKTRVQTGSVEDGQEVRPDFTAPALRGSFKIEKAERTRGGGRSRVLRNENELTERVSVRKAQWLVGNL